MVRTVEPEKPTLTVGYKLLFVGFPLILLLIAGSYGFEMTREMTQRADCQSAMKQFGLDFKRFANASEGVWPVLEPIDDLWVPALEPLYEKYRHVTNPANMVSIYHPDRKRLQGELTEAWSLPDYAEVARVFGESFGYLGYMVQSESEFETLRLARMQRAILPDGTLPLAISPAMVFPLKEGVERFLITDINGPASSISYQSAIPVLVEIVTWKYKRSAATFKGTNVLFMDGHVEFCELGEFPVLPSVLNTLSGL